jgi:PhzF family phenazine biosynthesis protein
MTRFAYTEVDVFTDTPLTGNPVAVVHGADALDDAQMQAFARWTNLSETTFVLAPTAPEADYRVRIWTPGGELPFAGHPTLGTCHAWRERGGVPKTPGRVVQQCGVGLVPIRASGARSAFAAPTPRMSAVDEATLLPVLAALGLARDRVRAARWLDNGPKWLGLHVDDAATVLALEPDHSALRTLAKVGVLGAHPAGGPADVEVRAFAAPIGIPEDPVTGSLNASFAQWLIGEGVLPARYVAAQGTRLQRAGRVHIERDGDTVWVGGDSVACVQGELTL